MITSNGPLCNIFWIRSVLLSHSIRQSCEGGYLTNPLRGGTWIQSYAAFCLLNRFRCFWMFWKVEVMAVLYFSTKNVFIEKTKSYSRLKKNSELFFENFSRKFFEILKFSFFKLTFRRKNFEIFRSRKIFFELENFSKFFSSESQFEK